ncbi:hypothetical protein DFJ73DRAFT_368379 [Zopfochytrium polystomum]|nr:hypothetical protein DFJ73DRAFT_368379 [Zopfochytrium polystomum]
MGGAASKSVRVAPAAVGTTPLAPAKTSAETLRRSEIGKVAPSSDDGDARHSAPPSAPIEATASPTTSAEAQNLENKGGSSEFKPVLHQPSTTSLMDLPTPVLHTPSSASLVEIEIVGATTLNADNSIHNAVVPQGDAEPPPRAWETLASPLRESKTDVAFPPDEISPATSTVVEFTAELVCAVPTADGAEKATANCESGESELPHLADNEASPAIPDAARTVLEQQLELYKSRLDDANDRLQEAEETAARLRDELVSMRRDDLRAGRALTPDRANNAQAEARNETEMEGPLFAIAAEDHRTKKRKDPALIEMAQYAAPELLLAIESARGEAHATAASIGARSRLVDIDGKPPLYPGAPPPNPLELGPPRNPSRGLAPSIQPISLSNRQSHLTLAQSLPPLGLPSLAGLGTSSSHVYVGAQMEAELRKAKSQIQEIIERYERRLAKVKQRAGKQRAEAAVRIFELEEEVAALTKMSRVGVGSKPGSPAALEPLSKPSDALAMQALQEQIDLKNKVIMDLSVRVTELTQQLAMAGK